MCRFIETIELNNPIELFCVYLEESVICVIRRMAKSNRRCTIEFAETNLSFNADKVLQNQVKMFFVDLIAFLRIKFLINLRLEKGNVWEWQRCKKKSCSNDIDKNGPVILLKLDQSKFTGSYTIWFEHTPFVPVRSYS